MSLSTWWDNTRPPKHAAPTNPAVSAREWRIAQVVLVVVSLIALGLLTVGPAGKQPTQTERTLAECYKVEFGGCQYHPHYQRSKARG